MKKSHKFLHLKHKGKEKIKNEKLDLTLMIPEVSAKNFLKVKEDKKKRNYLTLLKIINE